MHWGMVVVWISEPQKRQAARASSSAACARCRCPQPLVRLFPCAAARPPCALVMRRRFLPFTALCHRSSPLIRLALPPVWLLRCRVLVPSLFYPGIACSLCAQAPALVSWAASDEYRSQMMVERELPSASISLPFLIRTAHS